MLWIACRCAILLASSRHRMAAYNWLLNGVLWVKFATSYHHPPNSDACASVHVNLHTYYMCYYRLWSQCVQEIFAKRSIMLKFRFYFAFCLKFLLKLKSLFYLSFKHRSKIQIMLLVRWQHRSFSVYYAISNKAARRYIDYLEISACSFKQWCPWGLD